MLTIQDGTAWTSTNKTQQFLREIDLAGNTIRETNTGAIANQLVAMGATDATPCGQVPHSPPVGTACLNDFHHDAIRYLNGKLYSLSGARRKALSARAARTTHTGTVDILSEMVIVLNPNWQVVWYYDAFQQLDINRAAPLGETCASG